MSARVAYLNHDTILGGAEESLAELIRRLDRSRFEPLVVLPHEGPLAEKMRGRGVEVLVFEMEIENFKGHLLKNLWASRKLGRELRRRGVALIHANSIKAALVGVLVGRSARVPVIGHVRDLRDHGRINRRLLARADRLVAISGAVAATLPKGNTTVIPNGVDLERFTPADDADRRSSAFRHELGIGPDAPLVVTIGRLVPRKGYDDFIRAAAGVVREVPTARFAIVGAASSPGERQYADGLRELTDSLGLSEVLTWTGFRTDVVDIMKGLDILAMASWAEPFGRTLIEAMATSKPVVAVAGGGVPEIVADGETGVLTPPRDPDALARAFVELLGDPERVARYGRAGRERAEAEFGLATHVARIQALYDEVLAGRRVGLNRGRVG